MNSTILAASVPTTQGEVLGPIARRLANNPRNRAGSLGAWLESHLDQYTDAVRALGQPGGSRVATPHYLR